MDLDPDAAGFGGVILAGGTAARMGGVDKAGIEVAGRTLLSYAIDAFLDASDVVVVGAPVPTSRPATFVREDPAGGGPVAGLLTGVDALAGRPRLVGVLAVDMPRVSAATMRRLREAAVADGTDGAFLHDATGRRQLAGVIDADRLAAVRPDLEAQHGMAQHGMALHQLLAPLRLAEVAAIDQEAHDIDTWTDLHDLESDSRPRAGH